jgi:uncharacterized protein
MDFLSKLLHLEDINKAAREGDMKKVRALLAKKPSLIKAVDKFGYTPLHWAASQGNTVLVRFLLTLRPDINAVEKFGYTPLKLAIQGNYNDVIKLIRSAGGRENVDPPARKPE